MKDETPLVDEVAAALPADFVQLRATFLAAVKEEQAATEARKKYLEGLPHLADLEKRWVEAYRASDTAKAALLKWVVDNP